MNSCSEGAGETSKPDGRKQAELASLLERVEKAEGRDRKLDGDLALAFGWRHVMEPIPGREPISCWYAPEGVEKFVPSYTASLDAAVALVEKMLPEHNIIVRMYVLEPSTDVELINMTRSGGSNFEANAKTPALALCAALLRALIACAPPAETQEGSGTNRPPTSPAHEE